MSVLLDSGILLDYLSGVPAARKVLDSRPNSAISVITWVELMALAPADKEESTRNFLRRFERLAFNEAIADRAAQVARAHPDVTFSFAINYATARINSLDLVTVDLADSFRKEANVNVPYVREKTARMQLRRGA